MIKCNTRELRLALEASRNASLVAKQFGLSPRQVYYFAKTRKIELRHQGRPQKYQYNKDNLLKAIKRAIKIKGGLLRLSQRRNIPYHVITNLSKKF